MSARSRHRFFDIDPLLSILEQGATILTPNFRLARRIRTVWGEHQSRQGKRCWQSVDVQPVAQYLQACWETAVETDLLAPSVLLEPGQAQELWLEVIREHQQRTGQCTTGAQPKHMLCHRQKEQPPVASGVLREII